MTRVYLAARYSRRAELCEYRAQLQAIGYEVTSRWLNGAHQVYLDGKPLGPEQEALIESGGAAPELRGRFAAEDWNDLTSAEVVINFTEPPRSKASRGGRHVEFGAALALDLRCIVVGPRENVFHCLPEVQWFETWAEAFGALVPAPVATLVLERKDQTDETAHIGPISLAPPVDEDYWLFRVRLTQQQAIVGFPKFTTIGIGFAVEDDWNTNLPYTVPAEQIYDHIEHNKADDSITRDDCLTAIRLIQEAATALIGGRA